MFRFSLGARFCFSCNLTHRAMGSLPPLGHVACSIRFTARNEAVLSEKFGTFVLVTDVANRTWPKVTSDLL